MDRDPATGKLLPGHRVRPLRRGGPSKAELIAEYLAPKQVEVMDKLSDLAVAGDPRSIALFLAYIASPPREPEEAVSIPGLATATTLQDRAQAVIAAVADGQCSATAGERLLRCLDIFARAGEIDELKARMDRLEAGRHTDIGEIA